VALAASEESVDEIGESEHVPEALSIAEAARQLGVSRPRIYALLRAGQLEPALAAGSTRVTTASVLLRREREAPTGAPLSPASAWAVLALAAGDAAMLGHLAGRLSAADRSRSRARVLTEGLLALVSRLGRRAVVRRFSATHDTVAALASDRNIVLGGVSAAAAHRWPLPDADRSPASPDFDGYLSELSLADVVERCELEPDDSGQVVLRAVREPWPFRPSFGSRLPSSSPSTWPNRTCHRSPRSVAAGWPSSRTPSTRAGAGGMRPNLPCVHSWQAQPTTPRLTPRRLDRRRRSRQKRKTGTIGRRRTSSSWWRCSSSPPSR
jgi:excisionase family DNA binding protein